MEHGRAYVDERGPRALRPRGAERHEGVSNVGWEVYAQPDRADYQYARDRVNLHAQVVKRPEWIDLNKLKKREQWWTGNLCLFVCEGVFSVYFFIS